MILGERFWSKVRKTKTCWLWTASGVNGYGQYWFGNKLRLAHKVSYFCDKGLISAGLQLDHLCRNRACIRPSHLEPVTASENNRRSPRKVKTHCKYGHLFSGYNLVERNCGSRGCRACLIISSRRWVAKHKSPVATKSK